uniref:Uncharacterized protein n=1 Tax=Sander lucioperca TaxID=283035 RepID=A0A8D0CVA3_SANLU
MLQSNVTPTFLTAGLVYEARAPKLKAELFGIPEVLKVIHSVLSSFKLRKFCESHNLISLIQLNREFSATLSFGFKGK